MAYTTAQRTSLIAAIAEGALIVAYGDRRVQYRSQKEMLELLQIMEAELGITAKAERNLRLSSTQKGLAP